MAMYTAVTTTNMITKLNENGKSGIDGGEVITLKSAEAKLSQIVGLSETQIVYVIPIVAAWGTGISILIEPVEDAATVSLRRSPKNMKRLAPGVKPLPEIFTDESIGPLVGFSVNDVA